MSDVNPYKFKRTDLLIPILCVSLSLIIFFAGTLPVSGKDKGNTVVITVDGEEYMRLPLDQEQDIMIPGHRGLNNHLVIHDGEADIIDALCHDKICVHQKKISHPGETIVCLPNRVVIGIEGKGEGEVDAVSR